MGDISVFDLPTVGQAAGRAHQVDLTSREYFEAVKILLTAMALERIARRAGFDEGAPAVRAEFARFHIVQIFASFRLSMSTS